MLRQDNFFVFKQLINENSERWKTLKNYYYKNYIYINYLFFIEAYCMENDSKNCLQLIREYTGYYKNQHKKIIKYKYIEWN